MKRAEKTMTVKTKKESSKDRQTFEKWLESFENEEDECFEAGVKKIKWREACLGHENMLMRACRVGKDERVLSLLQAGFPIHEEYAFRWDPLMIVIKTGQINKLQYLIDAGQEVKSGENGPCALVEAANQGHLKMVQMLVKAGADINEVNSAGLSALHQAIKNKKNNMVKWLLDHGATLKSRNDFKSAPVWNVLYWALSVRNKKAIELILERGWPINEKDENGITPLIYAMTLGDPEMITLLLNKGARWNIKDDTGKTALHHGARNSKNWIKVLSIKPQEIKKIINTVDSDGRTALMYCAQSGQLENVKALIQLGASVHKKDNDGKTALLLARERMRVNVENYLKKGQPTKGKPSTTNKKD